MYFFPLKKFRGHDGTVSGLKPGKCYEFEIVAVNKEGESLAMKIADPVFTLDNVRMSLVLLSMHSNT